MLTIHYMTIGKSYVEHCVRQRCMRGTYVVSHILQTDFHKSIFLICNLNCRGHAAPSPIAYQLPSRVWQKDSSTHHDEGCSGVNSGCESDTVPPFWSCCRWDRTRSRTRSPGSNLQYRWQLQGQHCLFPRRSIWCYYSRRWSFQGKPVSIFIAKGLWVPPSRYMWQSAVRLETPIHVVPFFLSFFLSSLPLK